VLSPLVDLPALTSNSYIVVVLQDSAPKAALFIKKQNLFLAH